MLRIISLILAVLFTANVVGLALRGAAGELNASSPSSGGSSSSQSQAQEHQPGQTPASGSSGAPESSSRSEAAPPESSESSQPADAEKTAELPERLTAELLMSDPNAAKVTIYCSANGKTLEADTATAKSAMTAVGIDSLPRTESAEELSADNGGDYIRVTCGEYSFYIFKKKDVGVLEVSGSKGYYTLPSGLYTKIYYAMLLA